MYFISKTISSTSILFGGPYASDCRYRVARSGRFVWLPNFWSLGDLVAGDWSQVHNGPYYRSRNVSNVDVFSTSLTFIGLLHLEFLLPRAGVAFRVERARRMP